MSIFSGVGSYLSAGAAFQGAKESSAASNVGQFLNDLTGTTANNEFNASESQKARDFEEYMSSTQYQRAVKDMQAAGLNPASLTSGSLSAASSGSGNAATSTPGSGSSILSALVSALAKAATKSSVININK